MNLNQSLQYKVKQSLLHKRILSNDSIYKIQTLQTHLQTIVDITNNKQCTLTEESQEYIYNSLNEGISTLFKIKNELGE